jgi:PAS domain S-box-containing protein
VDPLLLIGAAILVTDLSAWIPQLSDALLGLCKMTFRILIIEDQVYEREGLRATLTELGCEVCGIAKNSTEAVQLAKQTRPDLALVHMDVRELDDGFGIARELRLQNHVPVISVGPTSSEDILQQACSSGCVAYLAEPIRPDELDAAIRIALRQDFAAFAAFARHSWLTAMFESLSDGIIATGLDGVVRFLNPAAQVLTGWMPLEVIGKPIEEIYPLLDVRTTEEVPECQIRKVLESQLPTGKQRFLLTTRTGARIPVEDSASPILDGAALVGAVTIFTNIAGRIADEKASSDRQDRLSDDVGASHEALGQSKEELVSLTARLIDAQEEERRRLARELHDDLAQRAALAAQLVDRIANTGKQPSADLELLKSAVGGLSDGLREVSHRLYPAIIEDLGLSQALRSLVSDYRGLGLDLVGLIDDVPGDIPLSTATSFYRIAQEALHNTVRHAPGSPAKLSLKSNDGQIELLIEDAGPGFSLVHAKRLSGLGLLSMQERARIIGGSFNLQSTPGEGTVVLVTAPLKTHGAPKTNPSRRRSPSDA